ncbi:flagellar motor switch protein FliN [Marinimicrobium sp. C6131]|nr:flagellar motor switch protein FliN [Marinimicrobium sp. C6131]UZJ46203.1 flagellar motor switch protein FliN [Marinimicrobium sp. C6131]
MAAEWEAAMMEQGDDADSGDDSDESQASQSRSNDVDRVALDELTEDEQPNTNPDLDVILDIPVSISMEVGRTSITIRNLLQLNQGSVIELDRLAGEPLDVLVNGTLIAHGEVVVVNEKFGIRMTDVISPSERIKKLR